MPENVYWDQSKKRVVVEMTWEEARDLGHWLIEQKDGLGDVLVRVAKQGAGF